MPSSSTRFVEENRNASDGIRAAPFFAHRCGSVRARRARRTEAGCERDLADAIAPEHALHALFGNQRLHRARERKAEDQAPADLPRHPCGEHERFAGFVEQRQINRPVMR